jgi:cytochrome c oxidase cbb3-type subunit 4
MQMDLNDVRSLVTLASLALFLGLMAWTWWPGRKAAHDAAATLPFQGDTPGPEREAAPSRPASPRAVGRGTARTGG